MARERKSVKNDDLRYEVWIWMVFFSSIQTWKYDVYEWPKGNFSLWIPLHAIERLEKEVTCSQKSWRYMRHITGNQSVFSFNFHASFTINDWLLCQRFSQNSSWFDSVMVGPHSQLSHFVSIGMFFGFNANWFIISLFWFCWLLLLFMTIEIKYEEEKSTVSLYSNRMTWYSSVCVYTLIDK